MVRIKTTTVENEHYGVGVGTPVDVLFFMNMIDVGLLAGFDVISSWPAR